MMTAFLRKRGMTTKNHRDSTVAITVLAIDGMTCGTCERHVQRALEGLTGVIHAEVDLRRKKATVEHLLARADAALLVTTVREAGYDARVLETIADTQSVAPRQASGAACGCGCCGPSKRSTDWASLGTSTIG